MADPAAASWRERLLAVLVARLRYAQHHTQQFEQRLCAREQHISKYHAHALDQELLM